MIVVFLSASFFLPLRQLGSYFHVAMNGMTSTKRIFALLDAPEPARGDATLPGGGRDLTVTFDAVGYRYADAANCADTDSDTSATATALPAPALTDVSFTARPGTLTAIVGESGSGKSTTAALLAGTLAGYEGSITLSAGAAINGATPDPAELGAIDLQSVELRDLSADAMVSAVSLVSSRSHLFAGTLRENLLMAAPDAADDELWGALELTHIADFVREQPRGIGYADRPRCGEPVWRAAPTPGHRPRALLRNTTDLCLRRGHQQRGRRERGRDPGHDPRTGAVRHRDHDHAPHGERREPPTRWWCSTTVGWPKPARIRH